MLDTTTPRSQRTPADASEKPPSAHISDQAAAAIPAEIRAKPRWLVWKYQRPVGETKWRKPPINPRTGKAVDGHDPRNLMTFEEAQQLSRQKGDGIGYRLDAGEAAVDLDHCFDAQGQLQPWAKTIVRALDSYTERSPSGQGAHILLQGRKPGPKCKRASVEVYDHTGNYLTVTGSHLEGTPRTIEQRQQALEQLYATALEEIPTGGGGQGSADPRDEELLAKARNSDPDFVRLFDRGDLAGSNPSAADLALMNKLAFWFGRDAAAMERMFSRSALGKREKWTGRPDYRRRTIETSIAGCEQVYTGRRQPTRGEPASNGQAKPPRGARVAAGGDDRETPQTITRGGRIVSCVSNAVAWLEDPQNELRIELDTFRQVILVDGEPLTDSVLGSVLIRLERDTGTPWALDHVRTGIVVVGQRHASSALVTWLEGLSWDGKGRLDWFLAEAFGCEGDTEDEQAYLKAVGHVLCVSAVARAYKPGCQADLMPVLIGPQGIGKSAGIAGLCPVPDWFTDDLGGDLTDRKAAEGLQGKWLIEFSEFSRINRATIEVVKSFVTRRVDHYRPPYARMAQDFPRQCIFVGTTNNDHPLQDQENRRFLPVRCAAVDIAWIVEHREQLWAEAVDRFQRGAPWWIGCPTLCPTVVAMQDAARQIDCFEEILEHELGRRLSVTMHDAAEALRLPIDRLDRSMQTRIGLCLKALGFRRERPQKDGLRIYIWIR